MKNAHRSIVLACFLFAVSLAGCGVTRYETVEAKGATDGQVGFFFASEPDYTGSVTVRELEGPEHALHLTFQARAAGTPQIDDLHVAVGWRSWGHDVSPSPDAVRLFAETCALDRRCQRVPVTFVSPANAKTDRDHPDDLDLTISYTVQSPGPVTIPVVKHVKVHPARHENHYYPWLFRDC
jgi:hypothetical protein